MPAKPAAAEREPLTAAELPELLLWLFNTTGHWQHVEAWRRHQAAEKAAATRAKKED